MTSLAVETGFEPCMDVGSHPKAEVASQNLSSPTSPWFEQTFRITLDHDHVIKKIPDFGVQQNESGLKTFWNSCA